MAWNSTDLVDPLALKLKSPSSSRNRSFNDPNSEEQGPPNSVEHQGATEEDH